MEREQRGDYPGGIARRFDRAAVLGGLILFWTNRAFKTGLNRDSARFSSSPDGTMAVAAVIQRTRVRLWGRRKTTGLDL